MYLNLDLLENVNNYLFPIFYYENTRILYWSYYSPRTGKICYHDFEDSHFHNIYHSVLDYPVNYEKQGHQTKIDEKECLYFLKRN